MWLAKESVRDVYLADTSSDAELLLDKAIEGCRLDPVPQVRTLARWGSEILNRRKTGASNRPPRGSTSS